MIRRAFSPKAWPSSLDTVSAAASDKRRRHGKQEERPVVAEDGKRSAGRGNTKIGQNLGRLPAFPAFRDPQLLLSLIAEPGRDPGQREDGNQGRESSRAGAQVKYKAD